MTRKEKIAALRRLAASTTFEGERQAALAKAAELEGPNGPVERKDVFPTFDEAMETRINNWLEVEALSAAIAALGAVAWDDRHWVIPGRPPLLDKDALMRLYAEAA